MKRACGLGSTAISPDAVEMGFLRRMRATEELYEVQQILKAFVDAQWLSAFNERLEAYKRHGAGLGEAEEA